MGENVITPIRPMTVTIALMTDGDVTDAALSATQDALNDITENTFNTHVVLKLYTEEEYEAAVDAMIKARYQDQLDGKNLTSIGSNDMVELNEFNREFIVYPEPYENQIDIFMCTSFDMFRSYMNFTYVEGEGTENEIVHGPESVLTELRQYIDESTASIISKYYSESVLFYGKQDYRDSSNKDIYALPSNGVPSGYEYLLIDKKLFDDGKYDIENVRNDFNTDDITTISDYLVSLAKNEKTTGIVPLYNVTDMGVYSLTGSHSVLGQYVSADNSKPRNGFHPSNILQVENVKKTLSLFNDIRVAGGTYPTHTTDVDFSKSFGACYVSGDSTIYDESKETGIYTVNGKEYYVVLSGEPYFDSADVTDCMWAISSSCSDAARAMEVLTLINTNPKARNILLYGVENLSYYVDEDTGIVNRYRNTPVPVDYYTKDGKKVFNPDGSFAVDPKKNPSYTWTEGATYDIICNYNMDMYKTGNLFLVKPNSDMTEEELRMSANGWEKAKQAMHIGYFDPYT
jgi:hypothetical protein